MNKKSAGFTLIEMVIYIGLLSVLIVILSGIFLSTLDAQLESETAGTVSEDGRFILARLIYDIQRADSIVTPASIGTSSNTLQLTISGVNYSYSLNSGNLQINPGGSAASLNGYDTAVSNLSFQRLGKSGGKNSIQIIFTVTSITQRTSGPETKNFQTTVATR